MRGPLRLRVQMMLGMTLSAVLFVGIYFLLRGTYSSSCDPGNRRLHQLAAMPVIMVHPAAAAFSFENDRPDNSFLGCTWPTAGVNHFGFNLDAAYQQASDEFVATGWTLTFADDGQIVGGRHLRLFSRPGSYLSGRLQEDSFSVEVQVSDFTPH